MSRTIAIVIFPGFQLLDAAGPIAAFELAGRESTRPPYRIRVVSSAPGPVASSSGVMLTAEALPAPSGIDTLLVVGGRGTREADADPELLAWLRAAGILDGRRVTTHWRHAARLAHLYPQIRVEPDRIFVRDGHVWTSAGITAGIDLALALIAEDLGEALAKRTAQWLVVYHRRPGGQSQFSALLRLDSPGGRFGPLLGWARERLDEALPVERLAAQAAMSPRNFARAFVAETGMTPAKAIEHLRLEAARAHVEEGREAIDRVASATGFGDPERMRRAFIRGFGQPPQALRRPRLIVSPGRQPDRQAWSRVSRKRIAGHSSIVVRRSQALRARNTGTPSWSSANAAPLRVRNRSSSTGAASSQRAAS
jgi:transcriptional regulator GlxA family with amidase domain